MRVYLSEYITSGALSDQPLPASLLREGLAMRNALAGDMLALPGASVCVTRDPRVPDVAGAENRTAQSPAEERREFERLCSACDATLIIAPETAGVLKDRCAAAEVRSRAPLNCSPEAVALCGNKLSLANRLQSACILTLPTQPVGVPTAELKFPLVVKPQDGAGSQLTFLCRDDVELQSRLRAFSASTPAAVPLIQPYVPGRALSLAAMFSQYGLPLLWPIAAQRLSDDGTFQYLGGEVPVRDCDATAVEQLVLSAAAVVPGLRGYVGFDVLIPDGDAHRPLLVEINPRLTTSYVGYRRLAQSNLAGQWFERVPRSPAWRDVVIEYTAEGVGTERRTASAATNAGASVATGSY